MEVDASPPTARTTASAATNVTATRRFRDGGATIKMLATIAGTAST